MLSNKHSTLPVLTAELAIHSSNKRGPRVVVNILSICIVIQPVREFAVPSGEAALTATLKFPPPIVIFV